MIGKFISECIFQPPIEVIEDGQTYQILEVGHMAMSTMSVFKVLREDGTEVNWRRDTLSVQAISKITISFPEYCI